MGCLVTVVIATRNRRAGLLRTLHRLRGLPERPPIVVVDNASLDGTADAVGSGFPDVRVLRMPRNRGAPARNVGVRAAHTPYVAFSDDDSWWEPGALDRAAEVFARCPRLGLVAARTLVWPEGRPDPINAAMAASPLPATGLPGPPVLGFLACAALVRRRAFLAAGGFSEVLFFVGEERLLAYDLAALGWDLCYVPEVIAVHAPSTAARLPAGVRHRTELRNALLITWMRRPAWCAMRETARMAGHAVRDAGARRALAGAALRMPHALLDRRRLPPSVERAARLIEARS